MNNPLLSTLDLPAFSSIKTKHAIPAIEFCIDENLKLINTLTQLDNPDWDSVIQKLDEAENRLERAWSPVRHLNSVMNSDEQRDVYNQCRDMLTDYANKVGQNEALYKLYKTISNSDSFAALSKSKKQEIKNSLRDFRLSGVDLGAADKEKYKANSKRLAKLTSKFEENILDATNDWEKLIVDVEELKGIPVSSMDMFAQSAAQKQKQGYLITLQFPSYYAVITFAENRELRKEIYQAYMTRASDLGADLAWDNSTVMEEIIDLRHQQAGLLGFRNYAERSLFTKMAKSTEEVLDFLYDLSGRSRMAAEKDLADLKSFASDTYQMENIEAWDLAWLSEKLKQRLYQLSQEDLKPYFPANSVLEGLFKLVENLYSIHISKDSRAEVWHPDVEFYSIKDNKGNLRGQFYLDLYARDKKRGGAWMDECISRIRLADNTLQIPVAYMTCNGTPPVGGKPALFTHDEVLTLFHEFGHGLHHMLTQIDNYGVSGISGVEWDAVELPSQFMENWCWEKQTLDLFARHYETGKKLPQDLFKKMLAARNFQAALQMLRQLEFSIFDLRLYAEYDPVKGARVKQILAEVRDKVAVITPPEFNRFQHGFSHIFSGGYAAGYYSYKWAEVLSADAFARFEEEGLNSKQVGKDFLHEILEVGGSRDAMESFIAFRGRKPDIKALLKHNGLIQ